ADLVARTRAALADGAVTAAPEVSERARALLRSSDLDIAVDDVAPGDLIAVTAVAPDRAGLLAVVAGILAINRLDVRSARASGEGDMAVSEWTVDPVFGDAPDAEKLRADVRQALDGQINIADRLERREEAYPVSRQISLEPKVTVVPEASARATVVEVRTYDRPGTLFRLAWAIAGAGANIAAARADSLGSSVVDVFYLTGAEGRPLSGDALDAVVAKLAAIVES
ncbi:MAG: hypothetical protein U0904_03620, partial [Candidatus Nanopelagicales bacterium]|nr:hypothetical protein [Candidatus Nanopelagicales bacterium]